MSETTAPVAATVKRTIRSQFRAKEEAARQTEAAFFFSGSRLIASVLPRHPSGPLPVATSPPVPFSSNPRPRHLFAAATANISSRPSGTIKIPPEPPPMVNVLISLCVAASITEKFAPEPPGAPPEIKRASRTGTTSSGSLETATGRRRGHFLARHVDDRHRTVLRIGRPNLLAIRR
jgi:hypothetical protein